MFRFTMRELLLAVLVIALGLGWWIDRGRLVRAVKIWRMRASDAAEWMGHDGWAVTWRANGTDFRRGNTAGQSGFGFTMPPEWERPAK